VGMVCVVSEAAVRVLLPCGHCRGSGRKEAAKLTETLAVVLAAGWRTTQAIARALEIGETNAANRLADLLKLGLVERRGNRPHKWRRA
jgi:hypothetical protein